MQITETCSCGSEFNYDDSNPSNTIIPMALPSMLNEFREKHKCKNGLPATSPF